VTRTTTRPDFLIRTVFSPYGIGLEPGRRALTNSWTFRIPGRDTVTPTFTRPPAAVEARMLLTGSTRAPAPRGLVVAGAVVAGEAVPGWVTAPGAVVVPGGVVVSAGVVVTGGLGLGVGSLGGPPISVIVASAAWAVLVMPAPAMVSAQAAANTPAPRLRLEQVSMGESFLRRAL
jgi:hypothetical protein